MAEDERPLILTVDDEPCVCRVLKLKLARAGYQVEQALTAEEALEKLRTLDPDVLVTDVKMPGMSGIDLCRAVEKLRDPCSYLTIVLTSQLDPETREWVESSPVRKFVSKPFSPREVQAIIEEYLASRAPTGDAGLGAADPAAKVENRPSEIGNPK
jgi:CheY-like chemotaxis protein